MSIQPNTALSACAKPYEVAMTFENHGGPCKNGCERIACMCAHEKLARENEALRAKLGESERHAARDALLIYEAEKRAARAEAEREHLVDECDALGEMRAKRVEEAEGERDHHAAALDDALYALAGAKVCTPAETFKKAPPGCLGSTIRDLAAERDRYRRALVLLASLDCGDNSCLFAKAKTGMRTNGGCRCLGARTAPDKFRIISDLARDALEAAKERS
jgi:hypothetical protein